jgi:oxygen-independent coproporphyrinogen-3 oxidase
LDAAQTLVSAAANVKASWSRMHHEDFTPVCLNILLPYSCSLSCHYCYARPESAGEPSALNRLAVTAAARLVAANCARLGVPFQVDIQGEGEPACCWNDLLWCVEMTQAKAREAQVAWSSHLTTNGQTDAAQTDWIGRTFTHVTLSCDGPPDIQDACRPCRNGEPSSLRLEAAAAKLASGIEALDARVTVTAANIHRLNEVIRYISVRLGIQSIRLEPAFATISSEDIEPDPKVAAEMCLKACEAGEQHGIEVTAGSPRLTELHGAYCQALRGVLRIMPDGTASNCLHGVRRSMAYAVAIGRYDTATETYTLDMEGIGRLRRMAEDVPGHCRDCLNVFHCCRSCPDECPTAGLPAKHWRCRFQAFVAEYWILAMAGRACKIRQTDDGSIDLQFRRQIEAEVREIHDSQIRKEIAANTLLAAEWHPLDQAHMPAPTWEDERCRRRVPDVTETLTTAAATRDGDISVYVHLPFCRTRCVFCDCHSVVAPQDRGERLDAYIERLKRDIDIWCERGKIGRRPVSTIHFGGGTPLAIGEDRFSELVTILGNHLNVSCQTQLAIETTAACAMPGHINRLMNIGFRRLHVGVQTLNSDLRHKLGMPCRSTEVIERLCAAMKAGMVTSVDLLYGLPGQTVVMLAADVSLLAAAGIHGFSLYRLNLTQRNQRMLRVFPGYRPSPLRRCIMLQVAESLLLQKGYVKNHYAHYALPPEDNRYFRHAVRGEDMLGLGASAAGVFGDWEYRCLHYPQYMNGARTALPIETLTCQPMEARERMIAASLMAGRIPVAALSMPVAQNQVTGMAVSGAPPEDGSRVSIERLVQSWISFGLLAPDKDGLRLTATGTWMSGRMLEEFTELIIRNRITPAS